MLTYGRGGVDATRPVWETEPLVLSVLIVMVRQALMMTTMTVTVKLMMVTMMMLRHLHIPVKDD